LAIVEKEYLCENCGEFSEFQQHSEVYKKCPKCKSKNIERLISKPLLSKDNEPRTIGSQIDRNNKRNPLTREKIFGVGAEKKLEKESYYKKIAGLTGEAKERFLKDGTL
jgi:putative FmdB family regulatory protein